MTPSCHTNTDRIEGHDEQPDAEDDRDRQARQHGHCRYEVDVEVEDVDAEMLPTLQ